jgi:hypothetical protein
MINKCSVKGCPSSKDVSRIQQFFQVPLSNIETLRSWLEKVDLQLDICNLHFDDQSFLKTEDNCGERSLLSTAIPLEYKAI